VRGPEQRPRRYDGRDVPIEGHRDPGTLATDRCGREQVRAVRGLELVERRRFADGMFEQRIEGRFVEVRAAHQRVADRQLVRGRRREHGAIAREHDRARLIERGPRDEPRECANIEVDRSHCDERVARVVDRLRTRDAGLVALEEQVWLGPRSRAGLDREPVEAARARIVVRGLRALDGDRVALDREPRRTAAPIRMALLHLDLVILHELGAAKRAVGEADRKERDTGPTRHEVVQAHEHVLDRSRAIREHAQPREQWIGCA
jgi:hypothetical protein